MRISSDEAWEYGGAHAFVEQEEDALVLTRVAMGEAPGSLNDRILIMWLVRIRAELGYKNANTRGTYAPDDRWAEPTSIREEGLCIGGCQFEPIRHLANVYYPFTLRNQFRAMADPLPDQLGDFWLTYLAAQEIIRADLCEAPNEIMGYDSFKSPQVTGQGRYYWDKYDPLSLPSVKFFANGNVWQDYYPFDNHFFKENCNE